MTFAWSFFPDAFCFILAWTLGWSTYASKLAEHESPFASVRDKGSSERQPRRSAMLLSITLSTHRTCCVDVTTGLERPEYPCSWSMKLQNFALNRIILIGCGKGQSGLAKIGAAAGATEVAIGDPVTKAVKLQFQGFTYFQNSSDPFWFMIAVHLSMYLFVR